MKQWKYESNITKDFRKYVNPNIGVIDTRNILEYLKIPYRTKQNNGVSKPGRQYDMDAVNRYLCSYDGRREIDRTYVLFHTDKMPQDVQDLFFGKSKPKNDTVTRDENKEKMEQYLKSLDSNPEENMEKMSHDLLMKDDVMFEEENLSDVKTKWEPKEGIFLSKSPESIVRYLRANSKDDSQAIKRLTFYMNRAGENLKNKTVLNKAKAMLKESMSTSEWIQNKNVMDYVIDDMKNSKNIIIKERKKLVANIKVLQNQKDVYRREHENYFQKLYKAYTDIPLMIDSIINKLKGERKTYESKKEDMNDIN